MAKRTPRLRPSLDVATIQRCFTAYRDWVRLLAQRRESDDAYEFLQNAKLPMPCTQALARDLISTRVLLPDIEVSKATLGGRGAPDITLETVDGPKSVEVKATAADFTELSQGDTTADYFVWMDFRLFAETGEVTLYTVRGPVSRFGWSAHKSVHLGVFLAATIAERTECTYPLSIWEEQAPADAAG